MSKTVKDFVRDVDAAFGTGSHRKGLQALDPVDRQRITAKDPRKLAGSANIDTALEKTQPDANRWDYVVGQRQSASIELHWVEVHPARSDRNLDEVLRKLTWLRAVLAGKRLYNYPKQFIWIGSGKIVFSPGSPQQKRLANSGCRLVGHLHI